MTTPHNSALQGCQGHLWAQRPSGLSCHLQGHRPPTTVGEKHFMAVLGSSAPPSTPQELQGDLDGQSQIYFTSCSAHSQVLPFRGALVQPMLSHHLLEKDNTPGKHTNFLFRTSKLINWFFSLKDQASGPSTSSFAPACWASALHCKVLSGRSPAPGKLQTFHKGRGISDFTATAYLPLTLNLL